MSFLTALSGLQAAQTDISSTSNNIANVGTTGYHRTRVEFADIFTSSPFSNPDTAIGIGTQVSRVNRSFGQGSMSTTSNTLDLAIQGAGFFRVQSDIEDGEALYTRAGAFGLNDEGYVMNAAGQHLSALPTAMNGDVLDQGSFSALRVPPFRGEATATRNLGLSVNLPRGEAAAGTQAAVPPAAAFNPTDPETFAHSSPVNLIDASGQPKDAMMYFAMIDAPDATDPTSAYSVHLVVDGVEVTADDPTRAQLSFDADGLQIGGTEPVSYNIDGRALDVVLAGSQMGRGTFAVQSMAQDGGTVSKLSMLEVDKSGVVWANYGDTQAVALGMIPITTFANLSAMRNVGNASYAATREAGEPMVGMPGSDGFGSIRAGALEASNVDLTQELVNLITAQRNYQASAKALETNQTLASTIMNIR